MSNKEFSVESAAASIPELIRGCEDLLSRCREVQPTAAHINKLSDRRREMSRKLMSRSGVEDRAALSRQEARLQRQIDQLSKPFNETREAVRALAKRLRFALRFVDPRSDLLPIRDELQGIVAPYIATSKSFISLERALQDLSVIRARLPQLVVERPKNTEALTGTAAGRQPSSKRPERQRRGRRPISEEHQRKLAKILRPLMNENRWMIPKNLEPICKRLDTQKVPGPGGRSWSRTFEEDQLNRTRNAIGAIKHRLDSASYPAKSYLDG